MIILLCDVTGHRSPVQGIEHTLGYEGLNETGEGFERQAVAVLGLGNAAFETADALAPYVNDVHLIPGRARASAHAAGSAPSNAPADPHDLVSRESR